MKNSKYLKRVTILCLCLLLLATAASAQKRRTTRKAAKKPTATVAQTTATNTAEIKNSANKVSIQIMNVTKFIYLLGGVASGIEETDKQLQSIKASRGTVDKKMQAALDKNNDYKKLVIQSIRNLRAGLAELEVEFNSKPALRPYVFQIQGISGLSGTAEDQAAGGQFTESGKTLLLVVEKLSNTLAALP